LPHRDETLELLGFAPISASGAKASRQLRVRGRSKTKNPATPGFLQISDFSFADFMLFEMSRRLGPTPGVDRPQSLARYGLRPPNSISDRLIPPLPYEMTGYSRQKEYLAGSGQVDRRFL
jgi:hypothetical protein